MTDEQTEAMAIIERAAFEHAAELIQRESESGFAMTNDATRPALELDIELCGPSGGTCTARIDLRAWAIEVADMARDMDGDRHARSCAEAIAGALDALANDMRRTLVQPPAS